MSVGSLCKQSWVWPHPSHLLGGLTSPSRHPGTQELLWPGPLSLKFRDSQFLPDSHFPGDSDSKESACNAEDLGSIPGLGRSPPEGYGNPLQYPCPGNPMDRGAWWATVNGVAESQRQPSLSYPHSHLMALPPTPAHNLCRLLRGEERPRKTLSLLPKFPGPLGAHLTSPPPTPGDPPPTCPKRSPDKAWPWAHRVAIPA